MDFVERMAKSLDDAVAAENWYAALTLALTMPDICGWLETGTSRGKSRYIDWCREHLQPIYTTPHGPNGKATVPLSAPDTYALRCAVLHQGVDDVEDQEIGDVLAVFLFVEPPPDRNIVRRDLMGNMLQLQVNSFCDDVARAVSRWWETARLREDVQAAPNGR